MRALILVLLSIAVAAPRAAQGQDASEEWISAPQPLPPPATPPPPVVQPLPAPVQAQPVPQPAPQPIPRPAPGRIDGDLESYPRPAPQPAPLTIDQPLQPAMQPSARHDEQPSATAPLDGALPWYTPTRDEAFKPPVGANSRFPNEQPGGMALQLNFERGSFFGSDAVSTALTQRLFGAAVGLDMGYMALSGLDRFKYDDGAVSAFVLGVSFDHHGAPVLSKGIHHLYVVLPEIDGRLILSPQTVMLAPGVTVTGLRYAICLGSRLSLSAEVRGPSLYGNYDFETEEFSVSLGFGLAAGIGF